MKRTPLNRKTPLKAHKKAKIKRRASKLPKVKIWSTKKADRLFSAFIRNRDLYCKYPLCLETTTQCSHFWGRANSATRYDPDNCIALCYKHHYGDRIRGWEFQKQGAYRQFMITWLGQTKYDALERKADSVMKRKDAIIEVMKLLGL